MRTLRWGLLVAWLAAVGTQLGCSSADEPGAEAGGNELNARKREARTEHPDASPHGERNQSADASRSDAASANDAASAVPADANKDASAGGDAARDLLPETGILPAIADPWQPGPFTLVMEASAGPDGDGVLYYPDPLEAAGIRHPIVIWDEVAGLVEGDPDQYRRLVKHLASHGFAVYLAKATESGAEVLTAIDWMIAENERADGPLYQRLDPDRVAAGGHATGSDAVIAVGADPRLRTTLHAAGEPQQPYETITTLHAPAVFYCGRINPLGSEPAWPGSLCRPGFEQLNVPALRAELFGVLDDAVENSAQGVFAGWLRWQLADDVTMKAMFLGDECGLCTRPMWSVEHHGLQ